MSWLDKVKKFLAVKLLVTDQGIDQQTADMRWETCWNCDRMNHENRTCMECGCFIEAKIWSKTSRSINRPLGETTHCPLGKWNDKALTNRYRKQDGKDPLP